MIRTSRNHSISGVFVFVLMGVFAVFGTLLVLLGTNAYRSTVERTAAHNDTRLVETFVRHAVRAEDVLDHVTVETIDSHPVLLIGDPDGYCSYIYVEDGYLCEQYTYGGFEAGAGEKICEASGFGATIDGNVLRVMISTNDGTISLVNTSLRTVQGGDPS